MRRYFLKAIAIIGIVTFLILVVLFFVMHSNVSPGYHASDEVISPDEICSNPYKLKGHSGILDGGRLKFEKMIEEHTATYAVWAGEESIIPEGEIAVVLPDSDPPDSGRPWRVFVEGPMGAVNGLGNKITVTAVRFEGYYVPPPKPAEAATVPASTKPEDTGTRWTGEHIRWTAMSHTANAISGDVETSADSIAMSGITYPLVYVRDLRGDELQDSAQSLDVQMSSSSGLEGRLFRTNIPAASRLINGNTICGSENAAWVLAVVTRGDGSGSASGDLLYLAFFSGDAEPILQAQAIGNSKALCGTYNYQRAASSPTLTGPR
jgi:hypothetical protein